MTLRLSLSVGVSCPPPSVKSVGRIRNFLIASACDTALLASATAWSISMSRSGSSRRSATVAASSLPWSAFPLWKADHGKDEAATVADLRDDPDLLMEIDQAVAEANKAVSHAEAIKKFRILPTDFTEGGGQLTPTLKLKRNVIVKEEEAEIAALYS